MKVYQNGDRYRIMAEINMVPLIDVALVLLIIFMVMTPILVASQIKLNLPGAASGTQSSDKTVEIQIDKGGTIHLQGRAVPVDRLQDRIKSVTAGPSSKHALLITADKDVPFDKVVLVMDAARQVGVQKMSIGVKRIQASSSRH
ncbi:MAG: biopolymer transporter ExbD [Kiritimatiellae bacterium]|nr:biopolymer transporter ExbD [Kiritimatiellia bacterium]MDD5523334.1 biopolymer transporter ExbD [Kiritimatiellia bacterium]